MAKLPKLDKATTVAVVIACFLFIVVVILAALLGEDINCYSFQAERDAKEAAAAKKAGPAMVHYPGIQGTKLVKLKDTSAKAYMKTIAFSKGNGAEMHATVLRVDKGPALKYTHWYESIMMVMSGSFTVNNGTAKTLTATAGQSLYIPRGSVISYTSNDASSFMYIASQPPNVQKATVIQAAIGVNPTTIGYPSMTLIPEAMSLHKKLTYFGGDNKDLSYLTDYLLSTVKGAEMTGGLYKLLKGPHLDYTYPYEEFKYIVSGEFQLTDGTGQKVSAKAGDLMYFPKGCPVRFTSPDFALGFYVGQRTGGTA